VFLREALIHQQQSLDVTMTRYDFLKWLASTAGYALLPTRVSTAAPPNAGANESLQFSKLQKPLSEWRRLLPPASYGVLFEERTEPPHSSSLNNEKRAGHYLCAACFLPLFDAHAKFDSGTGWPSFYQPIAGRTATKRDFHLILPRT